jgi:hypothetical protein
MITIKEPMVARLQSVRRSLTTTSRRETPRVQGNQTMLAVLARLFDNLGTVIPYEDLCLLIGHKSANSAATHVLRQYIAWLRDQLIATKAPYVITVAGGVGYAFLQDRRRAASYLDE